MRVGLPQSFTPEQLNLLKNQILAFKKIAKNLPISDTVHATVIGPLKATSQPPEPQPQMSPIQAIQTTQSTQSAPSQEILSAASRLADSTPAKTASPSPPQQSDEPPLLSPHQFFRRKISLADHSRRD